MRRSTSSRTTRLQDVVEATGDVGLLPTSPSAADGSRRAAAASSSPRGLRGRRASGLRRHGDFSTVPSRSLLGDLIPEAHRARTSGPNAEPGPFSLAGSPSSTRTSTWQPRAADGRSPVYEPTPRLRQLRAVKSGRFGVLSPGPAVPGLPWGGRSSKSLGSCTRMRFAELDAVTLDAHGTLVELADPVPELDRGLRERGIARSGHEVARAFATEVEYYRDPPMRGATRRPLPGCGSSARRCSSMPSRPSSHRKRSWTHSSARSASRRCPERSGRCAPSGGEAWRWRSVDWDVGLQAHLDKAALGGLTVVTSAEAGAPKPAPAAFELAIERLGVRPDRTLHIGDSDADEEGARAAGLRFAPAPLATALGA